MTRDAPILHIHLPGHTPRQIGSTPDGKGVWRCAPTVAVLGGFLPLYWSEAKRWLRRFEVAWLALP